MRKSEAELKWCPMYRCSTDHGQLSDNATHGKGGYCCTTNCMMWRWETLISTEEKEGYCGLAGKEK
jgi:hypothetical protein